MTEFETLKAERIDFGEAGGEFLELSINVARSASRETKYLRIARGYYSGEDGEPRYKKGGVTLPANRETLDKLADAIKAWDLSLMEGASGGDE